jgi:hypothetical protein
MKSKKDTIDEDKAVIAEIQSLLPRWTSNISESYAGTIIEEVWDKIDNYSNNESIELEEIAFYFNAREIAQALQNGIEKFDTEFFLVMILEKDDEDYSLEFNLATEKLIYDFQSSTNKIITPYLESVIEIEILGAKLVGQQPQFMENITSGIGTNFASVTLPGLLGIVKTLEFKHMYDKCTETDIDEIADIFDASVMKSFEQYNDMVDSLQENSKKLLLSFWSKAINEADAFEKREAKKLLQDIKDQIQEYESQDEENE